MASKYYPKQVNTCNKNVLHFFTFLHFFWKGGSGAEFWASKGFSFKLKKHIILNSMIFFHNFVIIFAIFWILNINVCFLNHSLASSHKFYINFFRQKWRQLFYFDCKSLMTVASICLKLFSSSSKSLIWVFFKNLIMSPLFDIESLDLGISEIDYNISKNKKESLCYLITFVFPFWSFFAKKWLETVHYFD